MKFNDFTGLYPLSKTLRFEARPVGVTWQHIQQSGMLDEDQHRAESYKVVKKLIDEYHKAFIDGVMDTFSLPLTSQGKLNSLEEYLACYQSKEKSDTAKKQFAKIQENLRKAISQALRQNEAFKRIDKKELVETDLAAFVSRAADRLPDGLDMEQALAMIAEFKGFTTYFLGFHQNRSNLYVAEEQSTAIAYRLVHENLPRFVDNMAVFAQVAAVPEMQPCLAEIYRTFEAYLGVNRLGEMFSLGYFNTLLTQTQIEVYNGILGGRTSEDSRQKFQGLNEYINLYNQQHKDRRLPKFKMLYKQILSDRTALSWLPESFATDRQLLEAVGLCYASLQERVLSPGENGLQHLLSTLTTYDAEGIFLPADLQLTRISQKL
ncbi:MAG: type V CRISPR-associated protein Cas12a/Cpf1, partial [Alloprevotella sp.]|nr:type V CRISPR-associated protein Cas12a/Cpf1 [Alloprevotella sp.]